MSANQTMPVIKSYLPSTAALVVPAPNNMSIPGHVTLKSNAAGRLIELSTDGGVEYFTPAVDIQSATMQVLIVNAPVTHIRLTGNTNDLYLVS